MLVIVISSAVTFRFDVNASQIINIRRITATMEIKDPIDDVRFQRVYASG